MGEYRIKEVDGEGEEDDIHTLHDACFGDLVCPSLAEGWWWVVYDHKKEPVAFAQLRLSAQWSDTGYLARSGVIPWHRGRGLQRRLIRVREHKARGLGLVGMVTDTSPSNFASSNNMIRAGYELFEPSQPWSVPHALYWKKWL